MVNIITSYKPRVLFLFFINNYYNYFLQGSDVSVFGGGALSPKLSTQSEPRLEEDPVKQKITERILSLLLRVSFYFNCVCNFWPGSEAIFYM